MTSYLPPVHQLVTALDAAETEPLDRVRAAVEVADELGSLGDLLVTHYVEAARGSGCSWAQIGAQLGVSKQAAQQAFVAPPRKSRFGRRHGRWSDEAGLALKAAVAEASSLGHDHVGTEHLLLALVHGDGLAAQALRRLGAEYEAVRCHIEDIIGRGDAKASNHIPFTPRTKKVIELAARESVRLRHDEVRTEHLLLALIREGQGLAAQILVTKLGIDLPKIVKTVDELVNQDGGPRTPGGRPTG
jgi:ATP-dependent Clp protease ATP-binding subunit ClpC